MKRSSALQRRTPLRSGRRPLPLLSRRRRSEAVERAKVRKEVLVRDGFRCRLAGRWEHRCFGRLEVHHLAKASACGPYVVTNLIVLCQAANQLVEAEPEWAWEIGLVQRSGETDARVWGRLYAAGMSWSPVPGSPPLRLPGDAP